MNRKKILRDQGFELPFDACPIATPANWSYRGLMNTGGNVFCRIWHHETENMELMYNMLDGQVAIIDGKYHSEDKQYKGDMGNVIAEKSAGDDYTELDLMDLAVELMEANPN